MNTVSHRYRILSGALLLALSGAPLYAAVSDQGFYVGAGLGQAFADLDADAVSDPLSAAGFSVLGSGDDTDDSLFRLHAGYRFNRYLGIEGTWFELGDFGLETRIGGSNPGQIETELDMGSTFNLGLIASYPVAERFTLHAKLGAVLWSADVSSTARLASGTAQSSDDDSGTDLSLGLGVAVQITEHLAVRGDWDRLQLGGDLDTDLDLWSLGVQYRF